MLHLLKLISTEQISSMFSVTNDSLLCIFTLRKYLIIHSTKKNFRVKYFTPFKYICIFINSTNYLIMFLFNIRTEIPTGQRPYILVRLGTSTVPTNHQAYRKASEKLISSWKRACNQFDKKCVLWRLGWQFLPQYVILRLSQLKQVMPKLFQLYCSLSNPE